ncbi:RTA1 like protein-domain-containing protein [Emericellopsis atlantica]|uniref:RTA1 like protein-domain-containing protein n=1 Tax=Emericellopsis atlantica TaxID=2614577 RepID=A0A9P7ZI60_9HYPO|nr:RTA1 like protein-domain-containing protein [Emericellopsis atlantica]KAG9252232.1 RTA1 like protein-domain-containing protein [Emericellopsis atlantica]
MSSNDTTPKGYAPFDLYPYNPAQPPAYAFLAIFGIAAVLHLAAMIPYRSWFPLPMIVGCGMEAAGYYFRSRSHNDVRKILPFVIQHLLVLSAAPLLAATIYMSPRRISRVLEAEHLIVGRRWATKVFIVVDIGCFVTQAAGAILSGSEDPDEASNGRTTILAGLILQVCAFALFVACAVKFHTSMHSASLSLASSRNLAWQKYLYGLYVASLLFVVRNITRIVEYQQGSDGELLSNEVWLYVLDAVVMLAVVFVMLVLHPGRLRRKARKQMSVKPREDYIALT